MDKYRVTLTAEERVGVGTWFPRERQRPEADPCPILLLADTHGENLSDEDIVAALGTSLRTVARVRQARHPEPPVATRPQASTVSPGQDQDQGGPRAEVGRGGVQRSAPGPLPLDLAVARQRVGRAGPGRCRQHGDGAEGSEKNGSSAESVGAIPARGAAQGCETEPVSPPRPSGTRTTFSSPVSPCC